MRRSNISNATGRKTKSIRAVLGYKMGQASHAPVKDTSMHSIDKACAWHEWQRPGQGPGSQDPYEIQSRRRSKKALKKKAEDRMNGEPLRFLPSNSLPSLWLAASEGLTLPKCTKNIQKSISDTS